jgi:pimeloyl-ACP methyl ester carboxylesterase
MPQHTLYRTVKVDGLSIFYREAGPKDAPTILLLHDGGHSALDTAADDIADLVRRFMSNKN